LATRSPAPPSPARAPEEPSRTRATALPASERRAAIIEATVPLLLAHGASVTTRQIAEAAGIAEGTIFRVFPDKESLIEAVYEAAFDAKSVDEALRAIDRDLPLDARLERAVGIIRRRVADILKLRTVVEMMRGPNAVPTVPDRHRMSDNTALAELFETDRAQLRCEPREAAQLLRGLTIAGTHPAMIDEPLPSAEIVSLLLDGVRTRSNEATTAGGR